MSYSGANQARESRESLGKALAALQEDPNIPQDVLAVAQNIAQAVGALFEAERASSEPDGKACIRSALGTLSQTLALLQDVRQDHNGIAVATEVIAKSMSGLYPLTTVPSRLPPAASGRISVPSVPAAPRVPSGLQATPAQAPVAAPAPTGPRESLEVNIGATTESNFYVGFSGEVAEGGVFMATYEVLKRDTAVDMLVTLPGGFEFKALGRVRFVRDPMDICPPSPSPAWVSRSRTCHPRRASWCCASSASARRCSTTNRHGVGGGDGPSAPRRWAGTLFAGRGTTGPGMLGMCSCARPPFVPCPTGPWWTSTRIRALEDALTAEDGGLQDVLDSGYRELDRKQPVLGSFLAEEVSSRRDEMAQSLGYFLAVTVYMAFDEAFPTRLFAIDEDALRIAVDTLEADEELRANNPTEVLDSDDVVAMGQPTVLHFVQHHLQEALEQAGEEADLDDLDSIYRAILVEVIALSHAVTSPEGKAGPPREALA